MVTERFTAAQVRRLTGLSRRQLEEWEKSGFIEPAEIRGTGHGSRRAYSFENLIEYRAAVDLLNRGLSLQTVKKAVAALRSHVRSERPLAELRLVSDGRSVYVWKGEDLIEAIRGQLAFSIMLDDIRRGLRREIETLPGETAATDAAKTA